MLLSEKIEQEIISRAYYLVVSQAPRVIAEAYPNPTKMREVAPASLTYDETAVFLSGNSIVSHRHLADLVDKIGIKALFSNTCSEDWDEGVTSYILAHDKDCELLRHYLFSIMAT